MLRIINYILLITHHCKLSLKEGEKTQLKSGFNLGCDARHTIDAHTPVINLIPLVLFQAGLPIIIGIV